jgi:hypothetical protein
MLGIHWYYSLFHIPLLNPLQFRFCLLLGLSVQPISASLPSEIQALLAKFPTLLHPGDVVPNPTHGVEHYIHTAGHPPLCAKAHRLVPDKLEIAKVEFKC